jgi:mannose-6-phosphate isomerase-like protein (cupin superfamily)
MKLRKYRWSRDYESAEEELTSFFTRHKLTPERWHAEGREAFALRTHEYDMQLWCAEGSIILTIDGKAISLQPGDALDVPAGTPQSAVAGIAGVVCYEAHSNLS